jgi:two-component sensor histidine kinase/PAS domain-containing protein
MGNVASPPELIRENQRLAAELAEARELLHAVRKGEVDALVSSEGDAIYAIQLMALAVEEAETYADALAIVVKKLCEVTGCVYGEAWAATSNGQALERTNAWYGACSQAVFLHESVAGLALDAPEAALMQTLRSGEPQWIRVEELPASARSDAIRDCGMQTGLVLPIAKDRQVMAVLALWHAKRQSPDDAMLLSARKTLKQFAPFVQRKRAQEALQHTLVALERTVRDRSREMVELHGRLSDQSARRERAERLSSDRQQAVVLSEQEVKKQTALLQSILDSMAEGVLVTDRSGHVLQCNPAARNILGEVPVHVLPDLWPDVYGMYESDKVTRFASDEIPLAKALRGEKSDRVEIFIRGGAAPGGQMIAMSGRPLRDVSGAIYGAVAVFYDITRQRLEQERRIQYIEEQRDTLVREVHHRVKNNLAAIIQLMHRHKPEHPELDVFLKQIEKQLYAIATMYGLEASRDGGIQLGSLVRSVSTNAESLFGVHVNIAVAEYPLPALKLREEESVPVALILNELLVNACKHGNDEQIDVRIARDGDSAVIEVVNSAGPDIRIPDHETGDTRGSGLSLVRALLPHKARLEFRQSRSHILATLRLAPDIFASQST